MIVDLQSFGFSIQLLYKIELQIKQAENTVNDIAGELELVSNTNMVTKEIFITKTNW